MSGDINVTVTLEGPTTVSVTTVPPTVSTVGTPTITNTVSSSTEQVNVQELGIVGPRGPQGPTGPSGLNPQSYALTGASSWYHVHDYTYPPAVRLVDGSGEEVEIGVDYPDATSVSLVFPVPFTGTVYLS